VIPTREQLFTCYVLTVWVTKMYKPVVLVRVDERSGDIFFLAGAEIEVQIFPNGRWKFNYEAEF
jgi:hypothetical protein